MRRRPSDQPDPRALVVSTNGGGGSFAARVAAVRRQLAASGSRKRRLFPTPLRAAVVELIARRGPERTRGEVLLGLGLTFGSVHHWPEWRAVSSATFKKRRANGNGARHAVVPVEVTVPARTWRPSIDENGSADGAGGLALTTSSGLVVRGAALEIAALVRALEDGDA